MASKIPVLDGPDDFKLYYHTNDEGHVWLNAKNSPILLTEPLVGHIDSKDPQELWHSKVTRKGFFSSVTPPQTGGAVNSTTVTQQPPSHTDPTSPIQQIPEGIDTSVEPLKTVIDEYQENPGIIIKAMNNAMSYFTTPVRSDNRNSGTDPDDSNTASPQNTKTYSQKDVDQLLERTKMENITDRRNFETHIRNQYISEIENLKAEHQEQIASIETKIAEKMQNEIKNIQATSDKQIAKYVESIQLLQQKIQTLQQSNLNTPYMPHHNQPMNNESLASDKIEKSLHLFSSAIAHNLEQNTALYKEHYISSAKTYDGKDPTEFNNWLDNVNRLSRISGKNQLDVAIATSIGQLHKYISELVGSGLNWDMIKTMIQERFSECGSSIIARNKLTSLTQKTMAMHEYISEFSTLMEHAHGIKAMDPKSKILASNFIDGIQNPYIKNKLRMHDPVNLSTLYGFAIKEDQKQKIRELDFGSSSPQASAQCDVNAIKGSGCFKCGNNDHFIKDCPLNRDNDKKDSSPSHGQHKHYNDYRSKSVDENSIEKSMQAVTDLLKSLLKQNKPSHTSFNKSTHKHSYTNKHSDHKPSHKHSNQRYHKSGNRGYHNKGKYRNNTQVNEIGDCVSDCTSSCSDQSDEGEEFDSEELSTQDDSKN